MKNATKTKASFCYTKYIFLCITVHEPPNPDEVVRINVWKARRISKMRELIHERSRKF